MGRGRQKAKHQKIARALKYNTQSIDVTALERELSADRDDHGYGDRYADYSDEDEDEHAAESA